MSESLDRWFAEAILIHEGPLVRFLRRSWPSRDEVDDILQDTYVRVFESAAKALPQAPKSFLFTTARHLMIDRIRRRRVVSIEAVGGLGELDHLNVLIDEHSSETKASARQELRHLAAAFDALPPRCRDVLWLRRVEDLPQKEVAQKLGIPAKAVEKALARAVQLLATTAFGIWTESASGGGIDREVKRYGRENVHGRQSND
jgi:RNA polymerase sigma-70 factor (ECF subfamily)